jgi:hypothetical protein
MRFSNLFVIITLLAVAFLGYTTFVQGRVISSQRETIYTMAQNPACLIAPVTKRTFDGDIMEPRTIGGPNQGGTQ